MVFLGYESREAGAVLAEVFLQRENAERWSDASADRYVVAREVADEGRALEPGDLDEMVRIIQVVIEAGLLRDGLIGDRPDLFDSDEWSGEAFALERACNVVSALQGEFEFLRIKEDR